MSASTSIAGRPRLLDQRDIEIALLVALDLGFVDRGKTGGLQKPLDRRFSAADARALPLFLQIRLTHGNAVHGQRQAARGGESLRALIDEALGDELVGDHAAQIVGRLRLHARGNLFREQL
jgi:hypothetical protein